jgi:DNA-directed RNA polymerase alpha subunit
LRRQRPGLTERDEHRLPVGRKAKPNEVRGSDAAAAHPEPRDLLAAVPAADTTARAVSTSVSTIGQLVKLSREDVAAVHGVGAKSVDAIVEGLAEYGVTLAGDKVVT